MNRILGLDVGDKYIGIAVSDPLQITAQGYRT
ncbi:MAG: Holliday junction resolvase RuvX, partial [Eubacterium sp.]